MEQVKCSIWNVGVSQEHIERKKSVDTPRAKGFHSRLPWKRKKEHPSLVAARERNICEKCRIHLASYKCTEPTTKPQYIFTSAPRDTWAASGLRLEGRHAISTFKNVFNIYRKNSTWIHIFFLCSDFRKLLVFRPAAKGVFFTKVDRRLIFNQNILLYIYERKLQSWNCLDSKKLVK